jgi:hypothetical protein
MVPHAEMNKEHTCVLLILNKTTASPEADEV